MPCLLVAWWRGEVRRGEGLESEYARWLGRTKDMQGRSCVAAPVCPALRRKRRPLPFAHRLQSTAVWRLAGLWFWEVRTIVNMSYWIADLDNNDCILGFQESVVGRG
jgi:hypothetical protein